MQKYLDLLEAQLASVELGSNPENLYEPIQYILSLGGKRLRPLLVLLGYGLNKEDMATIVEPALAVELFHNFTLMHDDIMDDAPLRRGKPTVHEKWNQTVAILSGDTMMVKSYDYLLKCPHRSIPEVIQKFNKCAIEVCEGQQLDMNYENESIGEQNYLEMIRLKTAVLLGFSLEFGGILAEVDENQKRLLNQVGEKAGIGFQLMDDLLDVYADKAKFGKQVGGDIVANKKTYLLIKAMELASPVQQKELNYWIGKKEFDVEEKVNAVKNIYSDIGIRSLTEQKMNSYYDEAFSLLATYKGREEGKATLIRFFEQLMKRDR